METTNEAGTGQTARSRVGGPPAHTDVPGAEPNLSEQISELIRAALVHLDVSAHAIITDPDSGPVANANGVDIANTIHELGALLDDTSDLAAMATGVSTLDAATFSPTATIRHVVDAFASVCGERNLIIELHISPELPQTVQGDERRMGRALHHLIANVADRAGDGPVEVHVASSDASRLHFRVRSAGAQQPVASPDGRASIVRRFGVGRIVAEQLIELLGGSIEWIDAYECSFDLSFRAGRRIEDRLSSPGHQRKPGGTPRPVHDSHVLIVDDSEVNRLLASAQLERLGYQFSTACSGDEALERLTQEHFDAVLMDWHMPGLNGLDATRRWRSEHDPDHRLPIITMTASAMAGDRERCIEAGASDYLSKPVSIDDLSAMLARWTRSAADSERHAGAPGDESRIDDLIADLGDEAIVRSIIGAFIEMLPLHSSAATDALVDRDRAAVRRAAHTIKSTAIMLGTDELAAASVALEAAAVDDAVELDQLVADFARCCDAAVRSLSVFTAEYVEGRQSEDDEP